MGATYAGILGPLALATTLARGIKNGAGAETTFLIAAIALVVFAAIGGLVGTLAHGIVEDSVRTKFHAELSAREAE